MTSKLLTTIATFFTLLLSALMFSSPAFAHAHLVQQSPSADAQLTAAPQEIRLTFSEGIEPGFSTITLNGPGKTPVSTGPLHKVADDNRSVVVTPAQPLPPGSYQVNWQVVSVDGHKTHGNYRFTLK
ncbi:copper homeostasis periplasmic binding protein CopC [Shimwellia blattae]|uniref:Copper resistance protein C n=1 Tax=Shimwellia blattae (strain ATCC 29907 / DSM 4481 / JCM 1650 / NBRC 105725 / CDC 9005-74) TaxID=630626 RepID=I2B8G5_SHIBC|nr:copper homeostasis periplasmic binding protein CopC [Shimwellia blattae]AFJ46819.1 copper resistance C domain protein [Shimwellia blattae DSM 4481 = NBRC 105725]GAB82959.1 hypothetical protein YobA [Shimwellia blattae DSM 4481 = NBRC 105725]VDY64298.1 Copper resistance protein CopC [Shimwellia blattae]VEC22423.1 Copper resistance protein CopC [Shimwellia blattae]